MAVLARFHRVVTVYRMGETERLAFEPVDCTILRAACQTVFAASSACGSLILSNLLLEAEIKECGSWAALKGYRRQKADRVRPVNDFML